MMPRDCYVCKHYPPEEHGLLKDDGGGVTHVSLHNAHVLIERNGLPGMITTFFDRDLWHVVDAMFPDYSSFRFTGFSWGYRGAGPNGLAEFFQMIGLPVTLEEIISWERERPSRTWLRVGQEWKPIQASPSL